MDSAECSERVRINSSSLGVLNLRAVFKSRTLHLTVNYIFMHLHDTAITRSPSWLGPFLGQTGPTEPLWGLLSLQGERDAHQVSKALWSCY